MSLLHHTCVCHTRVSPPFHNETDPRHLDYVSDLEQRECVCASATLLGHTESTGRTGIRERVSSWI